MTDDDIMEMLRWTAGTLRLLDDMHTAADICVAAADRIADLRATEPAPSGWRPMKTAPKDGRVILGRWSDEDIATIAYRDGSWIWTMDGDGWRDNLGPGHWMPLPPPPADTTPQEDKR